MKNCIDCPICGASGTAEPRISFQRQNVESIACDVKVHAHECKECGCTFAGEDDSRLNKREMVCLKKRAFNLLSGKRVREIRNVLGLTIENANKVFGGGPVAFSKYENDDICQSELMDKLIIGAEKFPEFYDYLLDRAGMSVARKDVSVTKSETRPVVFVMEASDDVYDPKLYRRVPEGVKRVG